MPFLQGWLQTELSCPDASFRQHAGNFTDDDKQQPGGIRLRAAPRKCPWPTNAYFLVFCHHGELSSARTAVQVFCFECRTSLPTTFSVPCIVNIFGLNLCYNIFCTVGVRRGNKTHMTFCCPYRSYAGANVPFTTLNLKIPSVLQTHWGPQGTV